MEILIYIFYKYLLHLFFLRQVSFAIFKAKLFGLQPSCNKWKSTTLAFPPVNEEARRAYPHDCALCDGREPLEK